MYRNTLEPQTKNPATLLIEVNFLLYPSNDEHHMPLTVPMCISVEFRDWLTYNNMVPVCVVFLKHVMYI